LFSFVREEEQPSLARSRYIDYPRPGLVRLEISHINRVDCGILKELIKGLLHDPALPRQDVRRENFYDSNHRLIEGKMDVELIRITI
jgi:hypothetical protein